MERIAGAEKAAIADIRAAAIDIATTATSQIIRNNYAPIRDAAAVDQAIAGVPAALRSAV
jgi:F-type H+-transporting ATPase subunit b